MERGDRQTDRRNGKMGRTDGRNRKKGTDRQEEWKEGTESTLWTTFCPAGSCLVLLRCNVLKFKDNV